MLGQYGEEEEDEEGGLDLAFFDKESEAERLLVHQCNVSERTAERLGDALAENKHVKTVGWKTPTDLSVSSIPTHMSRQSSEHRDAWYVLWPNSSPCRTVRWRPRPACDSCCAG